MNTGKKYKTKQREFILDCIKEQKGSYVTIAQISDYLKNKGEEVCLSTIYRTLDKLENDKMINRITIEGIKGRCYKYPDENVSDDVFSMKCEKCGRVISIKCEELERLYDHISSEHHIMVNPEKTLLYGICGTCTDSEKSNNGMGN